jgi:hypothetical protein
MTIQDLYRRHREALMLARQAKDEWEAELCRKHLKHPCRLSPGTGAQRLRLIAGGGVAGSDPGHCFW